MLEFPVHVSCIHYIRVQNQKQNPHIILTNILPKKIWNRSQSSLLGDSLPNLAVDLRRLVPQWIMIVHGPLSFRMNYHKHHPSRPSPCLAQHHPSAPRVWLLGVLILDQSNGLLARLSSGGTWDAALLSSLHGMAWNIDPRSKSTIM
jgi:hypothetical protein